MALIGIVLILIAIALLVVVWKRIPDYAPSEDPKKHRREINQVLGIAGLGGLFALIGVVFCIARIFSLFLH